MGCCKSTPRNQGSDSDDGADRFPRVHYTAKRSAIDSQDGATQPAAEPIFTDAGTENGPPIMLQDMASGTAPGSTVAATDGTTAHALTTDKAAVVGVPKVEAGESSVKIAPNSGSRPSSQGSNKIQN